MIGSNQSGSKRRVKLRSKRRGKTLKLTELNFNIDYHRHCLLTLYVYNELFKTVEVR